MSLESKSNFMRGWRELALLHLIDHRVDPKDSEWWAQCKLNHTTAFPYLMLDIVRTVVTVLFYGVFMPAAFTITIGVLGSAIFICQHLIERGIRKEGHSAQKLYVAMRDLIVARAVLWGSVTAVGLYFAPPEFKMIIVPAAIMLMFIDSLCMITMPKRAVMAAAIHTSSIAVPLVLTATGPALMGVVVSIGSFIFLHWGLFNLYYLFATRRLRTKSLTDANDTIQLLLNQYDEDGSDWLIECDEDGAILRPTSRFCKAANRTAEELDGLLLSLLFKDCSEREELRAIGVREEDFRDLVVPLTVDGANRWWSISARPIYDENGALECWRGFIADVTRTREAEAKVSYMAHYDVLTNLPNRSLFNTTMRRAFERREADQLLAVLYVDLDHFKSINDAHGHAFGDLVLAEAARRIEQAVDTTAMVSRLGGDEFAVLLDRIDSRTDALKAAQGIVTAMDEPVEVDGQKMPIGASVGVAFAPDNGLTGEDVLRASDLALYDAKARGRRGTSLFDPAMQQEMQDRRALELDLRAALSRGELQLHYQPLLDAQTSETVGYEALLRWNHPTRGLVSPAVFIPIAEETGQIITIGSWVLREAVNECGNWPEHLSVSVNLSPAQMRDEALLNTIVGSLAQSGVAPERLELEITETLLMQDNEENIALLHRIRDLGVQIALDDFGTGYSSLNYLRSFPFDKIKIDRCFVKDMADKEDSDAIVQAVVSLAGKLNMRTTAEGVENEGQLERLKKNGCTHVQGFLFSEAKPPEQLQHGGDVRSVKAKIRDAVTRIQMPNTTQQGEPGNDRKAG